MTDFLARKSGSGIPKWQQAEMLHMVIIIVLKHPLNIVRHRTQEYRKSLSLPRQTV